MSCLEAGKLDVLTYTQCAETRLSAANSAKIHLFAGPSSLAERRSDSSGRPPLGQSSRACAVRGYQQPGSHRAECCLLSAWFGRKVGWLGWRMYILTPLFGHVPAIDKDKRNWIDQERLFWKTSD